MRRLATSLFLTLGMIASAAAQEYPTKPITLIVPFAAGGTSDIIARIATEEMSQHLGQRIVIENIAGAGGAEVDDLGHHVRPFGCSIARWCFAKRRGERLGYVM